MNKDEIRKLIESQLPDGTDFDSFVADFQKQMEELPVEEREALLSVGVEEAELQIRAQLAREDSPEGFAEYVYCITGMPLPQHAFYTWVIPTYYAHGAISEEQVEEYFDRPEAEKYRYVLDNMPEEMQETLGCVIYAAREMAKTTYNTVLWTSFRIGQEPWKANMIVQVGDDSAKKNASKIADIIDTFSGFKAVFPSVVPDREKAWGEKGYEVVDTSMDEGEWNKLNATRQDATLAGYGYTSSSIIGKHPDGVLIIDDIHNEINTMSQKELDKVLKVVQGTIFYAMTHTTWTTFVGTPWVEGDTLDFVAQTGLYWVIKVPAYFHVVWENGVKYYQIARKWDEEAEKVYMWPEERGETWVRRKNKATIPAEFKRMVLLTIDMGELQVYKYTDFPHGAIDWDWPMIQGVDPVATVNLTQGVLRGVSQFAMCYALQTPYNSLVVSGGVLEPCDAFEGEEHIVQAQRLYGGQVSIEGDGAGEIFTGMLSRNPGVKWFMYKTGDIGPGNKEQRQYKFLQPLLKLGLVTISDEDTPYLNTLRRYLQRFGLFKFAPDDPALDAADALVSAVFACPRIWTQVEVNPVETKDLRARHKKAKDPYASLAGYSYLKGAQ